MYTDFNGPGSNVEIYVALADFSDLSCCPGAYHADYTSGASATGISGSDSESGYDGGPYWLTVPWIEDDEIAVEGWMGFFCSVLNGYTGGYTPIETVSTFTFLYNYSYLRVEIINGEAWPVYQALGPNAACRHNEMRWQGMAENGRMRFSGFGQGILGTSRIACSGICAAGHATARGKPGSGAAIDSCGRLD
jgi:hypothetical protein